MKNILITGVAGLLGTNLSRHLLDKGYDVYGIDDLSGGYKDNVDKRLIYSKKFYELDLVNKNDVEDVFTRNDIDTVFHFAAYAAEGLSPFIRNYNYTNNVLSSINIINNCINYDAKIIFTSCHDEETRLVTKRGLLALDDIKNDDIVFTLNKEGNLEENKINDILISKYDGNMVSVEGRRVNNLITPNHRVLYKKNNKNLDYIESRQLLDRKTLTIPKSNGVSSYDDIELDICGINIDDFYYLLGLYIADGSCRKTQTIKENKPGLNRKEYLTKRDDIKHFIKGNTKDTTIKTISYDRRIVFCIPEGDKARKKLETVLKRNNLPCNKYLLSQKKYTWVSTNNKELYDIFISCGNCANEKFIPSKYLINNKDYLLNLFNGLMDGDGNKKYTQYTTVSKKLKDNFIELCVKIGKHISYKKYKPRTSLLNDGKMICGKFETYRINISKSNITLTDKNFNQQYYNGRVWCLNVDNSNFLIERKGKIGFSGNSMAVYGVGNPPFTEEQLPSPVDPYGIAKYTVEQDIRQANDQFDLNFNIVRPHNVLGIYQNIWDKYRNVIGIWIRQSLNGEPISIFGDGLQKRAFSDIKYYMDPFEKLIDGLDGEMFNIGADKEFTILETAKMVKEVAEEFGYKTELKHLEPRHEVKDAYCNHDKAKKMLNFEDNTDLKTLIRSMYGWAVEQPNRNIKLMDYEINKNMYSYWKKD